MLETVSQRMAQHLNTKEEKIIKNRKAQICKDQCSKQSVTERHRSENTNEGNSQ